MEKMLNKSDFKEFNDTIKLSKDRKLFEQLLEK